MYSILAKKNSHFIDPTRGGRSQRRSPPLHLSSGEVIRISPGQSIKISDVVFELNRAMLMSNSKAFDIVQLTKPVIEESPVEVPVPVEVMEPSEELPVSAESSPSEEPKKRGKKKKSEEPEVAAEDPEFERLLLEGLNG